jgi:hypothetical protein
MTSAFDGDQLAHAERFLDRDHGAHVWSD